MAASNPSCCARSRRRQIAETRSAVLAGRIAQAQQHAAAAAERDARPRRPRPTRRRPRPAGCGRPAPQQLPGAVVPRQVVHPARSQQQPDGDQPEQHRHRDRQANRGNRGDRRSPPRTRCSAADACGRRVIASDNRQTPSTASARRCRAPAARSADGRGGRSRHGTARAAAWSAPARRRSTAGRPASRRKPRRPPAAGWSAPQARLTRVRQADRHHHQPGADQRWARTDRPALASSA